MQNIKQTDLRDGLKFFGKINASVSHDIKNVLAVINEGAGLIDDLAMMAEKSVPLDPSKMRIMARNIIDQIKRGDDIIKSMNTFAHLVDEDTRQVDLEDALELVRNLSRRFAAARNVTIVEGNSSAVSIGTDPFTLSRLLHQAVWLGLDGFSNPGEMVLSCKPDEKGALITITGLDTPLVDEKSEVLKEIASEMDASIVLGDQGKSVEIHFSGE